VFQIGDSYFKTEDTIAMLEKLLDKHPKRNIAVFFDNCSIHVSKKAIAWMNE
jgi:hypothetical protein